MNKNIILVIIVLLLVIAIPVQVEARDITAIIHINKEAIKDSISSGLNHNAWYVVDGQEYSKFYHDMIEAVYTDDSDEPVFDDVVDTLTVADNASQICFADIDYISCGYINTTDRDGRAKIATEIHFSYPATWIPED